LSGLIFLALYIIVLTTYYYQQKDVIGGMAIAGVSVFVIGLFFWLAGVLNNAVFGIILGVMVVGFIALWVENK
ncbi:unnamed protein product, partial [marine sediment metagenome]